MTELRANATYQASHHSDLSLALDGEVMYSKSNEQKNAAKYISRHHELTEKIRLLPVIKLLLVES